MGKLSNKIEASEGSMTHSEAARIAGRAAKMAARADLRADDGYDYAARVLYQDAYKLMRLAYEKATDQVAEGE